MVTKRKIYSTDKYIITLASFLTDYDRILLTKLYQPLCGYGAIALYFTFWSEFEKEQKEPQKHQNIFNLTQMNLSEFETCRNRLEGIGLLKTYVKEDDSLYIYELYAPLMAKEFFKHELFGTLLKQKFAEEDYKKIKSYFKVSKENKKEFVNISHNFTEIYNLDLNDTNTLKTVILDDPTIIERKSAPIEADFNLDIFLLALKERKIKKSLIDKPLLELIHSMVNLYKLNENEICDIILATTDNNSLATRIDAQTFRRKCSEYKRMPLPVKKASSATKKSSISKKAEMLNELDPREFLMIRKENNELTIQDKKLIDDLKIISKLNDGVINVLLDYVLIKQNGKLNRPYVMKIASSLFEQDINTTEKAMDYFYKIKNGKSKVEASKEKKEEKENKVKVKANDVELQKKAEELKKMKKMIKERRENGTN